MQGVGLIRQGELKVYHLSFILPKPPLVNDFLWIWHNCLLLQERVATPTRIPNSVTKFKSDAVAGAGSPFQKNIIYKTVIVPLLT